MFTPSIIRLENHLFLILITALLLIESHCFILQINCVLYNVLSIIVQHVSNSSHRFLFFFFLVFFIIYYNTCTYTHYNTPMMQIILVNQSLLYNIKCVVDFLHRITFILYLLFGTKYLTSLIYACNRIYYFNLCPK